jgi:phosphotransferase system  glucose/maltose/N-acetylglucosamine-specific IIC component
MLEANDFRNFLFMPIPMLRTKKEQQAITKAFKSISLAAFGSLVFSTVANIKLTPYIIRKPAYVRLPIRTALFAIPLTASFFYIIRPALDGLVYVHMAIERRLMRFYRYGKVKDFFDK